MRSPERHNAGFTLIELLIVIVIIGIVASIAIVAIAGALDRAKQRATMADMRTVARTIEAYVVDNHYPPDDSGGLIALVPVMIPYQSDVLPTQDHWDRDLTYVKDAQGNYTLESFGKDGVAGSDVSHGNRFNYNLDIVLTNGLFVASPE